MHDSYSMIPNYPYHALQDGGFKCTVTITHIEDDDNWWYLSCEKCKVAAHQEGAYFTCSACQWTTTLPRFISYTLFINICNKHYAFPVSCTQY